MKTLIDSLRRGFTPTRLLLAMAVVINLIVAVNALFHSPYVGYDLPEHLKNVSVVAELRLPTRLDSREFFSPPLPYLIPAIFYALGASLWWAGKAGQLVNIFLSIGVTYYLLRICEQISPGQIRLKLWALGLLGMIPAYYKTFAQMRGEPYLVFLALVVTEYTIRVFIQPSGRKIDIIWLGLALGLAVLARQWGFFLFPAIGLTVLLLILSAPKTWKKQVATLSSVILLAFVVGGWFYIHLFQQFGTVLAFNRNPDTDKPKPASFYLGTGNGKLFTDPVRPSFGTQFLPLMYSEIWGDYHSYFLISIKNRQTDEFMSGAQLQKWLKKENGELPRWIQTNRFTFNHYLARVNMVSVLPTLILLAGLAYGLWLAIKAFRLPQTPESMSMTLVSFTTLFMVAGYLWFVIRYPHSGDGDTVKATYLLQVFPFVAIQTAVFLRQIRVRWVLILLAILLTLIALHNGPAMITHYVDFSQW